MNRKEKEAITEMLLHDIETARLWQVQKEKATEEDEKEAYFNLMWAYRSRTDAILEIMERLGIFSGEQRAEIMRDADKYTIEGE